MINTSLKLLLLSTLLLSGCAALPNFSHQPDSYAEAVASENWRRALQILDSLEQQQALASPEVVRKQLLTQISTREQQLIQEADAMVDQQQWSEALHILSEGQVTLPDSPRLQARMLSIREAQQRYIESLKQQLLIVEATSLANELPILKALAEARGDSFLEDWKLRRRRDEGYSLSEQLLDCAELALEEEQITVARSCLEPVAGLADSSQLQRLASAKRLLPDTARANASSLSVRPVKPLTVHSRPSSVQLKQDFEDSMQAGWLRTAGTSLQQLQRNFPADPDLAGLQASWQVAVDSYVAEKLRQGQALYGRGEIAEALKSWRKAARLAPDTPELQVNIDRAERFLNKIEVLEKQ